jgi:hypothetical protein
LYFLWKARLLPLSLIVYVVLGAPLARLLTWPVALTLLGAGGLRSLQKVIAPVDPLEPFLFLFIGLYFTAAYQLLTVAQNLGATWPQVGVSVAIIIATTAAARQKHLRRAVASAFPRPPPVSPGPHGADPHVGPTAAGPVQADRISLLETMGQPPGLSKVVGVAALLPLPLVAWALWESVGKVQWDQLAVELQPLLWPTFPSDVTLPSLADFTLSPTNPLLYKALAALGIHGAAAYCICYVISGYVTTSKALLPAEPREPEATANPIFAVFNALAAMAQAFYLIFAVVAVAAYAVAAAMEVAVLVIGAFYLSLSVFIGPEHAILTIVAIAITLLLNAKELHKAFRPVMTAFSWVFYFVYAARTLNAMIFFGYLLMNWLDEENVIVG